MPNSPSHEERKKVAADGLENNEVRSNHDEVGCLGSSLVGPGGNGGFEIGSGGNVKWANRRKVLGQSFSKAQSKPRTSSVSPGLVRPKKRSRCFDKEEEPGFGFVGFVPSPTAELDLNVCAQGSDAQADVPDLLSRKRLLQLSR
ncbi:hypothetical protein Hanom_Chr01g00008051 [Helianthus anomalus]